MLLGLSLAASPPCGLCGTAPTAQACEIRQRLEVQLPHLVAGMPPRRRRSHPRSPVSAPRRRTHAGSEPSAGRWARRWNSPAAWTIPSLIWYRDRWRGSRSFGRGDARGSSCLSRPVRSPRPASGGPSDESSGYPGNTSYRRASRISPTAAISASSDAPQRDHVEGVAPPVSIYRARNSAMAARDPAGFRSRTARRAPCRRPHCHSDVAPCFRRTCEPTPTPHVEGVVPGDRRLDLLRSLTTVHLFDRLRVRRVDETQMPYQPSPRRPAVGSPHRSGLRRGSAAAPLTPGRMNAFSNWKTPSKSTASPDRSARTI